MQHAIRSRPAPAPMRALLGAFGVMLVTLVAVGGVIGTSSRPAAAETGDVEWSVQPGGVDAPDGREAFDYGVSPGTVVSDRLVLTNFSSTEETFRVYAADATTEYETGAFTLIGSDRASSGVGAWTSVDGGTSACPQEPAAQLDACLASLGVAVTLRPGERATIPFTLTVPHDATPGDHAGGVVAVHTRSETGSDGAQVVRENRVGARVYLRVDGPLDPSLTVTGLVSGYTASWNPFASGTGSVDFDIVNDGNVRLSAETALAITGPFGIDFGQYAPARVANIVPGGVAHVHAELPGVPPLLLMFAEVTVVPVVGDGGLSADDPVPPRYTGSTTAWAVPWSWLAIVVLLGGGATIVVWHRKRTRALLAHDLEAYRDHVLSEAGMHTRTPVEDPRP